MFVLFYRYRFALLYTAYLVCCHREQWIFTFGNTAKNLLKYDLNCYSDVFKVLDKSINYIMDISIYAANSVSASPYCNYILKEYKMYIKNM